MNRKHGSSLYTTLAFHDEKEGCAGLELHRLFEGKNLLVAKIVFWDACGQFFLETFNCDLPVDIVEELIAEAKEEIKIA